MRHRILAEVLKKVDAPLGRADLAFLANVMLEKTEPLRRETLARRHKMVDGSNREITYSQMQTSLARLLRQLDEDGLSKLIVALAGRSGYPHRGSQASSRGRGEDAKDRGNGVCRKADGSKQKQAAKKSTAKTSNAA